MSGVDVDIADHTSGWALMMACRRDRCGSSVYVQKN
jgi:hypothetical protein